MECDYALLLILVVQSNFYRINDRLVSINDENTKNKSLKDVENMWELLRKAPVIHLVLFSIDDCQISI